MPTKTATKKAAKKAVPKKAASKALKKTVSKVTKKAVKKTAKKAAAPKKANFKALVCAIDGECFWTRDGSILSNLEDLYLAFGSMDDQIFLHHVNPEKNDFADWTEYVLQDEACAADLRKAKKKTEAKKVVQKHLKQYTV